MTLASQTTVLHEEEVCKSKLINNNDPLAVGT